MCAAYFLTGRVSLLLSVPPAYASPIWPPAGLALAAAIIGGKRMLPGVLLGSFLLEASILRGDSLLIRYISAALIALGALLQVMVGLALVRRTSGIGNPLNRAASVVPVILWGGPVACLVNPTVATLTLWAFGCADCNDLAFTWGSWWIGDSVGVFFFTPMMLAWMAEPAALWRRRRATVVAPIAVAFALLIGLYMDTSAREANRQYQEFADRADGLADVLTRRLDAHVMLLQSLSALFASSYFVSEDEFGDFARTIHGFAPGLRAFSWAPLRHTQGRTRLPVEYVEPLEGNEAAIGLDLASEPRREEAVARARATNQPAATAPLHLLMDPEVTGVIVVAPTRDREGVEGIVLAAIDIRRFLASALPPEARAGIAMEILDTPTGEVLYRDEVPMANRRWSHELTPAGRPWQMTLWSTAAPGRSWFAWLVLLGGLLMAGLLVAVIIEIVTRAVQVEALVAARTSELQVANAALLRSNVDLQRFAYVASHDMREPLRVVTTYAELLAEETGPALSEEPRRRLQRVVENARRMQALVASLLQHARASGRVEPFRPTNLESIVRDALEHLSLSIKESGAVVEVGPMPTLTCDSVEMLSLFQNLLSNALKFRRPGVTSRISLSAARAPAGWEFSVRDNGVGIAPEHRERVFEMFQRLHPRDRYPGTGLGLAVCRQVVEHHGGEIRIVPVEGPGTLVRFTLPDRR